jgi:hypothetical protein
MKRDASSQHRQTSQNVPKCTPACRSSRLTNKGGLTATTVIHYIDFQLDKRFPSFLHLTFSSCADFIFVIDGFYVIGKSCYSKIITRLTCRTLRKSSERQQARQRQPSVFWEKTLPRPSSMLLFSTFSRQDLF